MRSNRRKSVFNFSTSYNENKINMADDTLTFTPTPPRSKSKFNEYIYKMNNDDKLIWLKNRE